MKNSKSKFNISMIVFAVLIVLSMSFYYIGQSVPKTPEEKHKARIERQFNRDGSHIKLTRHIKVGLNDPDSYQNIITVYSDSIDYLLVYASFRAKNKFGGYVKKTVAAKVDTFGNVIGILTEF